MTELIKEAEKKQDCELIHKYVALIYYKNGLRAKWGAWSEKLEGSWQDIMQQLSVARRQPETYQRVVIYPS